MTNRSRIAFDTNLLAYAEGTNGALMRDKAQQVIQQLPQDLIVLPAQTLGELFNVLVRKVKRSPQRARHAVLSWCDAYAVVETSSIVVASAIDLSPDHGLSIWDSVVLSASAHAGCRLLLSEDLQEGFTWRGVTVANPFSSDLHPVLAGWLR